MATSLLLTSMTSSTVKINNPKTQKAFNDFFVKRSFLYTSLTELENNYKTKFNFFQRLKINLAKRKISRQLRQENLLDGCDTIKLKSGEEINAIVSEIGTTEVKYKKCDNKTGPTYSIKKSDILSVTYANGSKDFFGNEKPASENNDTIVNSADAATDPLAIASVAAVAGGILLAFAFGAPAFFLLIPIGIVLGFVSRSRIKKSNGKLKGNGLAGAGIITGFIFIALMIIAIIAYTGSWAW
jgi:hypothetical protein